MCRIFRTCPAHAEPNLIPPMNLKSLLISTSLGLGLSASAAPVYMSVQVQDGVLRQTPGAFGKPVAKLKYADMVEVLGANGSWYKVRGYGDAQGWLHQNSLTRKALTTSGAGGTAATRASSSEVALAGKGFNSDIEAKFKADNQTMDFQTIDAMERVKISEADSLKFLRDGGVRPKGVTL